MTASSTSFTSSSFTSSPMGFLTHILCQSVMTWLLWTTATGSRLHVLAPRQSSDGCGPNPLVALMSYAREFADFSPEQLMRFIESDNRARVQLRGLLKAYDDCVRTGEGTRYKRVPPPPPPPPTPQQQQEQQQPRPARKHPWFQPDYLRHYQSWKLLLPNLVVNMNQQEDQGKDPAF